MPDFPTPDPLPPVQAALRARLEELLAGEPYEHRDRFWESDDGGQAEFAWTTVVSTGTGRTVTVGFDMLDDLVFVAVDLPRRRWWRWGESSWRQGDTLDDVDDPGRVADEVVAHVVESIRVR